MVALEKPKWLTDTSDGSGARIGLVGLALALPWSRLVCSVSVLAQFHAEPSTIHIHRVRPSSGPFVRV